jgi:hypothetical protein
MEEYLEKLKLQILIINKYSINHKDFSKFNISFINVFGFVS